VVCFFSVLDPCYYWGGGGGGLSLVSNFFLKKNSTSNAPRGGIQVLFGH